MKKEYFIVQSAYNGSDMGIAYLCLADAGASGFYWDQDRRAAREFPTERSAYLTALSHFSSSIINILLDTVRVVRVSEETIEKTEVLEP